MLLLIPTLLNACTDKQTNKFPKTIHNIYKPHSNLNIFVAMGSLPQPLNPSISTASSSTPPSLSASVNPSNLIDASQTTPSPTKLSSSNMNNDLSTQNGRAKRDKRDSRKKREAKGTLEGANDAPREKKSTTSSSSSAIPASELTMLMPIQLADPRPSDVLPPKPRQMNFAYEKHSGVLGQSWKFYEIADKYVLA